MAVRMENAVGGVVTPPRGSREAPGGPDQVIGGRAPTWAHTAPPEDEDYEPTIVRGRD